MATKAKKKAAPKKAATKAKPKARKAAAPKGPATVVANHRFPPGAEVWFLPLHVVTVERNLNREPMATPARVAAVAKDGTLKVSGLPKGMWCAAGKIADEWIYQQFPIGLS